MTATHLNRLRILAVDDDSDILDVYRDALAQALHTATPNLQLLESALFKGTPPTATTPTFDLTCCNQGEKAVAVVRDAYKRQQPFAVVFLDMHMPPGQSGLWTAEQIRQIDPDIEIVFVTGMHNFDPEQIAQRILPRDKLFYVQKPFMPQEIRQFASALGYKWSVAKLLQAKNTELYTVNEQLKQDIIHRRQTEEHLRLLKTAIDHSTEATLLTRTASDFFAAPIIYANPAFARLTGYAVEEAVGQTPRLLQGKRSDPGQIDRLNQKIAAGQSYGGEITQQRRDGTSFINEWHIDPVRDEHGTITHWVAVLRDVTEARRQARQMAHQATHDALTGLANRREFNDRLAKTLHSAQKRSTQHVLCYLDLDHFKIVNDTAGHQADDELLKQVVKLMQHEIRSRDTLARLGGDEFGLLLENCPLEKALSIGHTLIDTVRDYYFTWEQRTFRIGVSIGIVPIPTSGIEVAELMRRADAACYTAKNRGRNRLHVYQPDTGPNGGEQGDSLYAATLTDALQHNRFCLYYQPVIPLNGDKTPHYYELLLRLQAGDDRLLLPGEFLPAARRYNLLPEIDHWVIRTALHCFQQAFGHDPAARIGVNLSGATLNDDHLPEFVSRLLHETGVSADRVCFELTESTAIDNLAHAAQLMGTMKAQGFCFVLDNFGSGGTSFNHLKQLPVDYLKINGQFVRSMTANPVDRTMVAAINEAGHILGIRTIAEYAETAAIVEQLRELHVDYAQGYFLSPPQPLTDRYFKEQA